MGVFCHLEMTEGGSQVALREVVFPGPHLSMSAWKDETGWSCSVLTVSVTGKV